MSATRSRTADFTEARYTEIVRDAKSFYRFKSFDEPCEQPHVLWRHDIDYSVHRAMRLAEIEAEEGVTATYFFLLHSPFYNLLEPEITKLARQILALGHDAGLHFDPTYYDGRGGEWNLGDRIAFERNILEDLLGQQVKIASFHNPDYARLLAITDSHLGGLLNVYGGRIRTDYTYVSDSFGFWRFRPLHDIIHARTLTRLHVLTHPVWWVPEGIGPRRRIMRCIEGRACSMQEYYDCLLKHAGMFETVLAQELPADVERGVAGQSGT